MAYAVRKDGRGWRAINNLSDCLPDEDFSETIPEPSQYQIEALAAAEAKKDKLVALNTITVTTSSGKVFDGNETARNNMMSAIISAEFVGQTSAEWTLADNTKAVVTVDEVKEALALSIQRVGQIVTA
ncbi:MAG: DUF4376 domain-containing protein [Methylotenera sp.]|nr:DUF4376 domain-containing protein [Methylotenera sp.]